MGVVAENICVTVVDAEKLRFARKLLWVSDLVKAGIIPAAGCSQVLTRFSFEG